MFCGEFFGGVSITTCQCFQQHAAPPFPGATPVFHPASCPDPALRTRVKIRREAGIGTRSWKPITTRSGAGSKTLPKGSCECRDRRGVLFGAGEREQNGSCLAGNWQSRGVVDAKDSAMKLDELEWCACRLVQAMNDSESELLFPGAEGKQRSPHFNLKAIVKRTLVRADLVEKYVLRCRRWKCGYREEACEPVSKRCPRCDLPLWSKAIPRDVGFHGLRHSTATLLLKSKVPYAIVQRIMRHRDPRLTTETYGHLEVDDMRIALDELAAGTAPAISEAAAASDRQGFGTYLVPSSSETLVRARVRTANPTRAQTKVSGPSRIRTWDQSVMSRQL